MEMGFNPKVIAMLRREKEISWRQQERLLKQHRQLDTSSKRILEINPKHDLIRTLAEAVGKGGTNDRINDAVEDTFASRDDFTRTSIEEAARKHQVCPFELGLDLSLWSDVLICDYNYVFDPKAYLRRYFLETGGNYGFLVDEAHNLVDRARDMYSAQIRRSQVRSVIRDLGKDLPAVRHVLGTLDHYFKTQIQRCQDEGSGDGWLDRNPPDDLQPLLQRVQAAIEPVLARNRPTSWKETLTDLFFTIVAFLRVYDLFDEHYVTYGASTVSIRQAVSARPANAAARSPSSLPR